MKHIIFTILFSISQLAYSQNEEPYKRILPLNDNGVIE